MTARRGEGKPKAKRVTVVKGWAWLIRSNVYRDAGEWVLCYWAMPSRRQLFAEGKPTDEARAVRVRISLLKKPRAVAGKGKGTK